MLFELSAGEGYFAGVAAHLIGPFDQYYVEFVLFQVERDHDGSKSSVNFFLQRFFLLEEFSADTFRQKLLAVLALIIDHESLAFRPR